MKKSKAIWGAGFLGGRELLMLGKENVDFFIDSNLEKKGTYYSSKPVKCVDEISNWKDIYIYVPETYFLSIEPVLNRYNLKEKQDYELFDGKYTFDYATMVKGYERSIKEVNDKKECMKNRILFWGWNFSEKKYNEYFRMVYENNSSFEYAVIAENLWTDIEDAEKKNGAPTVMAPNVFCYESYLISADNKEYLVEVDETIKKAVELLMKFCPEITYDCAVLQVTFMLKYIEKLLEVVEPRYIFVSWARNVRSLLLKHACKKKNIIVYAAPGILPGTYTFDPFGESGHCIPNLNISEFCKKCVTDEELIEAEKLIEELRISGENRKILQEINLESIEFNKKERPTVLFAAQPDTDFTPYDEEVQVHYSPNFTTSREAGIYISEICKKNGWNYIFKSHPMYIQEGIETELVGDAIHVEQGNINTLVDSVDIIVTIQSSVSYVSMIRNKPVVMLGYNHMRGKGCCYEAYELSKIEETMKSALKNGITKEMQENFVLHIAQLKKYYLYDDMSRKTTLRGKAILKSVEEIFQNRNMKEEC